MRGPCSHHTLLRNHHRGNVRQRVTLQIQLLPVLTAIVAGIDAAIAESGVEFAGCNCQRVGEAGERLRQATSKRLPGAVATPAIDVRLGITVWIVRLTWARAGRDIPGIGVGGIGRQSPGIVAVAALIDALPGSTAIMTPRRAAAARFVGATRSVRMPGKGMHVTLRV